MLSQPQEFRILQKQFNTVGGVFKGVPKMMQACRKPTAIAAAIKGAMAGAALALSQYQSAQYANICLQANLLLDTPRLTESTQQDLLRIKHSAGADDILVQAKLLEELEVITIYLAEN